MSRSCRERLEIKEPEIEVGRARNELMALNEKFSRLTLWSRLIQSSQYREEERTIQKRIRDAELAISERKKRHGST
jgi:hypothetical protein